MNTDLPGCQPATTPSDENDAPYGYGDCRCRRVSGEPDPDCQRCDGTGDVPLTRRDVEGMREDERRAARKE